MVLGLLRLPGSWNVISSYDKKRYVVYNSPKYSDFLNIKFGDYFVVNLVETEVRRPAGKHSHRQRLYPKRHKSARVPSVPTLKTEKGELILYAAAKTAACSKREGKVGVDEMIIGFSAERNLLSPRSIFMITDTQIRAGIPTPHSVVVI